MGIMPKRNSGFSRVTSASSGRYVCGSRRRKSKMPVPPGLSPVANDAQATGDSGGFVVPSGSNVPDCARRARFGRCPSLAHLESRLGSAPSKPRTTTCVVTGRAVPPSVYDAFTASDSKGKFLNENLKGLYQYVKVP